jgi:hypothetical protein
MRIIGQFRDEDDPDRFVWLRGFRDMASRAEALTAFYLEGDAWKAHREAANATMLDSSNALLLRPVAGFRLPDDRPEPGVTALPSSRFMATICHLDAPVDGAFVRFFDERVRPVLSATGAHLVACFETEPSENTFPRLPVREGENVLIWFTSFEDDDRRRDHLDRLARSAEWNEAVLPELSARLSRPPQRLNLVPTARSLLR